MAIDASIPLQVQAPANPLAQYSQLAQLQNMQTQGRMADLAVQKEQRGLERQNKLSQLLSGQYATPDAREQALLQGGFADESLKLGKDRRENVKMDVETGAKKQETGIKANEAIGQTLGALMRVPGVGPQQIASSMQQLVDAGVLAPELAQKIVAGVPQDPAQIPAFLQTGRDRVMSAKEQRSYTDVDANTTANNQTSRANNAANNAVQMRGQNLTDSRARETLNATITKPFEITGPNGPILVQQNRQGKIMPVEGYLPKQGASKPLTEGQSKALLFGSRMQESGAVLDDLAGKGVNVSMPGSRAGFGIGTAVNALQPEDRQRLDQAKRDFINATLRRESGAVIAKEEFDNGDKQYFPQPGDSDSVIAQKKRNREVATRGILAEVPDSDNRVSKVRGGATGDFSKPGKAGSNIDALLDKYK